MITGEHAYKIAYNSALAYLTGHDPFSRSANERIAIRAAIRVSAGVDWLNVTYDGNWSTKVELRKLSLSSTCNCVLGQVYKDECVEDNDDLDGYTLATRWYAPRGDVAVWSASRGFDHDDEAGITYPLLTAVWKDVIKEAQE